MHLHRTPAELIGARAVINGHLRMRLLAWLALDLTVGAAIAGCGGGIGDALLPDPVGHIVDVHARPWSAEVAPDARIVETTAPVQRLRSDIVMRDTRQAFVVSNEGGAEVDRQVEFVYFTSGARCFRIEGLPLPWRPFSDLAWASDRYLVFDRWSQPHYGVHYVVDTIERRVVHVAAFPDQFFIDQQRESLTAGGR